MNALILFAVQSLFSAPAPETELPKFSELEPLAAAKEPYPWLGLRSMALWTGFGAGLHIEDAWGYGADATVTLDYGKTAYLGFAVGYVGWNTRTEPSAGIPKDSVWVRQYRVGIFGSFNFRFLEVGIAANTGGYRYRRDNHNDTAGFFEFQAMIGGRPNDFIWIGLVAMQTFTVTDFNHSSDHGYANYSVGPAVELRF